MIESPQKENGYVAIANDIIEALAKAMPGHTEGQIICAVLRKTYGWNKKEDAISISQLCELTGKSKRSVIYSLQNLEAKHMIVVRRAYKNGERQTNAISFNKHHNQWVVQNCAPQVQKNRQQAKVSSAKLRGSAKLVKTVVQNSGKNLPSFAHTKDTNKRHYTKDSSASPTKPLAKHLYPLALFIICRGITFDSYEQVQECISRYVKTSKTLSVYSPPQIVSALLHAERLSDGHDVTLETVGKKIMAYKDAPPPKEHAGGVRLLLERFEKEKDILLSTHSPLIHDLGKPSA